MIREARKGDEQAIMDLIHGLALYEKAPEQVVNTAEDLAIHLFEEKICDAIVAEKDEQIVGFALYYTNYSTWKGKLGIAPTNASFQAFVTAMRVVEGEEKTLAWLEAMKENAVIFEKNGAILEAVEAGVVDVGLINHYYWFALAKEQGLENMKSTGEHLWNSWCNGV